MVTLRRILCLLAIMSAVALPAQGRRPNFLVLVSDDQRPDTIAALGNEVIETPNLDSLVRDGVSFSRAVCSSPICVASRAEILTGRIGFTTGALAVRENRVRESQRSWPRTLADAGYETWYVGKWHTAGRPSDWGYSETLGLYSGGGGKWMEPQKDWKGFEVTGYRGWVFQTDEKELFPERGVGLTPNISAKFANAAVELIEHGSEKPFFLHVNFTAPHDPLLMPPGMEGEYRAEAMELPPNFLPQHPFDHGNFEGRDEALLPWPRPRGLVKEVLAMYYSVVTDLDRQVGRILKALDDSGQRENTVVIFTSDHGIAVGSHGLRGKQNMYEHTINVPLIVGGPGIEKGKVSDAQVYLRELFPTTCELAGVPVEAELDGRSFAPVLRGEQEDPRRDEIYGYFRDCQRMIRTDRWKLIHYPLIGRDQLFDLSRDPYELEDLSASADHREVREKLERRLETWRSEVGDPVAN
ncbi:MAG: sulfatase-like hydrolase/transferase [Verrucomicrobiales bacterium]